MALDERYITDLSLQQYFVDKDTGEALANGYVYFFEDDNRNTLKPVYELSGAPPNYTYSALPNPVRLSAVGTPMNASNEDTAIYLYPFEADGETLQLYYIAVYDEDMNEQFTREAWPNLSQAENPVSDAGIGVTNELTNPTFSEVLFDSANNLVLNYTGATVNGTYFDIAPGWQLRVVHSATGSVTVSRQAVAGNSGYNTNPAYTLTISAATNATALELVQRFNGTPGLWTEHLTDGDGWVATSITIANGSSVDLIYRPSTGTETTLLSANNISGVYEEYRATTQLEPSDNTDTSATGYVDFVVSLPVGSTTVLASVMAAGMSSGEENIPFDQVPNARNVDHMFNYYKGQLEYKPIPSHLTGWHFPTNPAQWGAAFSAAAIGANKSDYVWDQTIIFQDTDSGFSASRDATGALKVTIAVADTQVALVQYLEQEAAREVLNDKIAVHIAANKSTGNDVNGLVSLWYTTDANLPDMSSGTNNSLVSALAANADVTAGNGTWSQVPRRNGERAAFTLTSSTTENFNDIMLNGWDMEGIAAVSTATYFAVVVSFEDQALNDVMDFHSIALCSGDIATRPAAISQQQSLRECQRYYWKTFDPATVPAQNVGAGSGNTGEIRDEVVQAGASGNYYSTIFFPSQMYAIPDLTFYNPAAANAFVYNFNAGTSASATDITNCSVTVNSFNIRYIGLAGWAQGERVGVHAVADARLGIV